MIPRYSRPAMAAIWVEEAKFARWLEVELAVCRAWARRGVIPPDDLAAIEANAAFTVARSQELEKTTNHDVVAFLTDVAEHVGPASRWIHYGMTSSDVLDTGLGLAIASAGELLVAGQAALTTTLRGLALAHRDTVAVGRTHGVHAEPTSFGLKIAGYAFESRRNEERLARGVAQCAVGKLSGAVGTYATLPPDLEAEVLTELGLGAEPVSTQVVARDRHAELVTALAVAASSLDRLATELRHLQRTEVREAEEAFTIGQKGSSAMPHKRNPIASENLAGLARIVRAAVIPALEDVALWHERDISHSSVERMIAPDTTTTLGYMLDRATSLVEGLVVYPENMMQNLGRSGGLHFSEGVMLAMVEKGLARQAAYVIVQRSAMKAFHGEGAFRENLKADPQVVATLSEPEIDACFDLDHVLAHVPAIIERAIAAE